MNSVKYAQVWQLDQTLVDTENKDIRYYIGIILQII